MGYTLQGEKWARYGYFGRCRECGAIDVLEFTFLDGKQIWCELCIDATSRKMGIVLPYQRMGKPTNCAYCGEDLETQFDEKGEGRFDPGSS
jgi:hypothetical protein